jgi:hypothetical protein
VPVANYKLDRNPINFCSTTRVEMWLLGRTFRFLFLSSQIQLAQFVLEFWRLVERDFVRDCLEVTARMNSNKDT